MATPLAIGMKLRVRHYCFESVAQQVGINTLYYQVDQLVGTITDLQLAAQVADDYNDLYAALFPATSTYQGCGISIMNADGLTQNTSEAYAADILPGTAAGTQVPLQASLLITLRTGLAGRNRRGRIYPPFPSSAFMNANGQFVAPGIAALQALAAQFALNISALVGGDSVQASPRVRGTIAPPAIPVGFYAITSTLARTRFATQRRRGQYGRTNTPPQ